AEHEQQQDDADVGPDVDELLAEVEGEQPALAEGESAEEVEGDGGEAEAVGEPRQDRQPEDGGPQLDEDPGHLGGHDTEPPQRASPPEAGRRPPPPDRNGAGRSPGSMASWGRGLFVRRFIRFTRFLYSRRLQWSRKTQGRRRLACRGPCRHGPALKE